MTDWEKLVLAAKLANPIPVMLVPNDNGDYWALSDDERHKELQLSRSLQELQAIALETKDLRLAIAVSYWMEHYESTQSLLQVSRMLKEIDTMLTADEIRRI
jgi:hypothetical protein